VDRRALGLAGERAAETALARSGMRVVARNQRSRFGEIDLVCRDRDGYVFVEVKTRSAASFVAAAEAVDRRKLGLREEKRLWLPVKQTFVK